MDYKEKAVETVACGTRKEMFLSALQERRMTLTELAQIAEITLAGAKQHLALLESAGLVRKIDEGRKWKYYELANETRWLR